MNKRQNYVLFLNLTVFVMLSSRLFISLYFTPRFKLSAFGVLLGHSHTRIIGYIWHYM